MISTKRYPKQRTIFDQPTPSIQIIATFQNLPKWYCQSSSCTLHLCQHSFRQDEGSALHVNLRPIPRISFAFYFYYYEISDAIWLRKYTTQHTFCSGRISSLCQGTRLPFVISWAYPYCCELPTAFWLKRLSATPAAISISLDAEGCGVLLDGREWVRRNRAEAGGLRWRHAGCT